MQTESTSLLRLPAVLATVGLGRTAWLDLVRDRAAPQPIKIGRATAWPADEVQAFIRQRITQSRQPRPAAAPAAPEIAPTKQGEVRLTFAGSSVFFRHHQGVPEMVVEHGCADGGAYVSGESALRLVAEQIQQLLGPNARLSGGP